MFIRTFLLLLFLCAPACADGVIVDRGTRVALEMPRQVGVASHSDGRETLTVWNTVRAESGAMAWVLPLPSVPDIIQQTDPAAVKLLRLETAPVVRLVRFPAVSWIPGCYWLAIAVGCLCTPFRRLRRWVYGGIWGSLAYMIIVGAFSGYGQSLTHIPLPARVLTETTAGDYHTSVISGDSVAQVNEWLTKNGFHAFEGTRAKVVEDYISKKWVFLCAKLNADTPGLIQTHPLTVRFLTDTLIYPMQLTQEAGEVPVELYLIGDEKRIDASGRMQATWATSSRRSLNRPDLAEILELVKAQRLEPEMPSDVMGDIDVPLVPAGKDALLDSLVEAGPEITVFSHTFTPTDDWADILFTPGEPEIPARQFNTKWNVLAEVVFYSGGMLSLLALVLLAAEARYVTPPGQRPASKWRWLAFGLVAGIMATAFFVTAEDVVWIDSSLIPHAGAGEKETILSLSQAWMKSILALRGS